MKNIKSIFKKKLSEIGFSNKKDIFFLEGQDVVVVVNLQKSNYSDVFFVNIGVWIKAIGGDSCIPKESACHVRFRADSIILKSFPEVEVANLFKDVEMTDNQKRKMEDVIDLYLVPLLGSISSLDGLIKLYKSGFLNSGFVGGVAIEFFKRFVN